MFHIYCYLKVKMAETDEDLQVFPQNGGQARMIHHGHSLLKNIFFVILNTITFMPSFVSRYVLSVYLNLKLLGGNPHPNSCSLWVYEMTDRKRFHLTKYFINYVGLSCSAWTSNGYNANRIFNFLQHLNSLGNRTKGTSDITRLFQLSC